MQPILTLPDTLMDPVDAALFPEHVLRYRNQRAATQVGLDGLSDDAWMTHFGRFVPLPGNLPRPLALRYHGHQFDHYNPQLGDGRGFLFAQLQDDAGRWLDLGTKGTGTTPYSRGGDGRLTLQGAVREILAAERLEALGVPTCRIFSVVETGEALQRHDEPSPTRSAAMVRLSHSHIRVGTFQRLAWFEDAESMAALVHYCCTVLFPELSGLPAAEQPAALLERSADQALATLGGWMAAGFVHGVLNSDNQNITGESFDYGPWRFLPKWEPGFTAAYFDHGGLYAFGRQPTAVVTNLFRLKQAMETTMGLDGGGASLEGLQERYERSLSAAMLWRLGLLPTTAEADLAVVVELGRFMAAVPVLPDHLFFDWVGGEVSAQRALEGPRGSDYGALFDPVRRAWAAHEPRHDLDLAHPVWNQPPSDLHIDRVRAIWARIAEADDWSALNEAVAANRALGAALKGRD